MNRFLFLHLRTLVSCLGRMWRVRLATLFTVASVGIVLSLPLGLYTLSINLKSATEFVKSTPEITLYVSKNASADSITELRSSIQQLPDVSQVSVITADEALEEFKAITGIESIIEYVPENPLPTVLIVQPPKSISSPNDFQQLATTLRGLELVDAVEVDFEWLRRFYSIIGLVNIVFTIVSVLLISAAVLLICNTTRLSISSRQDEIMVIDQIGGTQSFIRRPFVYIAVMQSLLGVAIAATIIEVIRLTLEPYVAQLADLYASPFRLTGLTWQLWLTITLSVCVISWIASRITVKICLFRLAASKN